MRALLLSVLVVPVVAAAFLYGLFFLWGEDLPVPKTLEELRPSVRSIVLDTDGEPVGGFYVEDRVPVPLAKMPDHLIQAVLTAEDRRFYEHWGLNLAAIVRATLRNLRAGEVTQGASTITQQLARNLFLDQRRTLERKLKEIVLAVRLERSFSKDEILGLYLNRIYFGEGAYGVQAAAHRFFGKDVSALSVSEAAMIAGIPANPSRFSPVRHPERARARRDRVLHGMLATGALAPPEHAAAVAESLSVLQTASASGAAPYFLEYVRRALVDRYGTDRVYGGGLRIQTTLDLDLQRAAERAIDTHLREIEESQEYDVTYASHREQEGEEVSSRTPYLQAALIALEPQTGAILAMVGGRSFQDSEWNRAVQGRLQPGSAFKPFIYALALREGWRTNDILIDEPVRYYQSRIDSSDVWEPKNFKEGFEGPMTLRYALARSVNVPSVKLLEQLGPARLVDFVRDLGIEGRVPPYLSVALGTAEVTALELASAYGTFANQGIHVEPYAILRVEDRQGTTLEENRPTTTEVFDERTNAQLVSMLRSVMRWGTAATARAVMGFDAPAAGKTGTTDDYTDAWFIGFFPRCV
ncbi:MAG: PBP1A family penicillin-binding protein, partial [Candidatus Latescibacteria bacterium]|nr:PBP1A family penicillin-binding protein [Candidatus Latescibacterota bacterium]